MARPANYYGSRVETRLGYMEGKLDAAIIDLKEANAKLDSKHDDTIKDFRESMRQMESRLKEAVRDNKESMQQMESRLNEAVRDNKEALEKLVDKTESSRRWSIGIVVSIAITVIGSLVTFIIFLFTNGFQVPQA